MEIYTAGESEAGCPHKSPEVNTYSHAMQMGSVAIFGLGNVALDCARVLLRGEEALGRTDIARHAQQALKHSAVKRVDIIGRRGPVQVDVTF